jgi:NADPH:quinone reductase-like Zn-dependent oxidoreductase
MRAITINEFGGSAVFTSTEVAEPPVAAGQVLIEVAASSVNNVDTMIRQMGQELPFAPALPAILGMDVAGRIRAVGEGVTGFKPGDEVYGCAGGLGQLQGALADLMPADARLIAHKPKNLTMREAAALPLVGITAWEGLHRAGLTAGQRVLVHGGAGGVGHIALQLAKHKGAEVSATGGRAEQLQVISELGARAIDYTAETVDDYVAADTGGQGFDLVFDAVGGQNLSNSFAAARLNAQVATTVSMLELDLTPAHMKGLSLHVVFMLIPMIHDIGREVHGEILRKLADIAEAGALRPVLDSSDYSFSEVGKAHERLASGQALGKIVVENR